MHGWPPALTELYRQTRDHASRTRVSRPRFETFVAEGGSLAASAVVKIAGTNGKGSVAAMLEAVALAAGRRVGVFTSPHLLHLRERIRINGTEVDEDTLETFGRPLLEAVHRRINAGEGEGVPSFFEGLMYLALRLFAHARVDLAIFEAGIGGGSDVTSLLPSKLSALTTVGLDHTELLGPTLEAIGLDKVKIANPDSTLVMGPSVPASLQAILRRDCEARNVRMIPANVDSLRVVRHDLSGIEVDVQDGGGRQAVKVPLAGRHQLDNLAVCLNLVQDLIQRNVLAQSTALAGLSNTQWAGRMEVFDGDPTWILDGAHNPSGMSALLEALDTHVPFQHRVLVYGATTSHDYLRVTPVARRIAEDRYLVEGFYQAVASSGLRPHLTPVAACFSDPEGCVRQLRARYRNSGRTLVVTGSLFMVGQLRAHLLQETSCP